MTYQTPLGTDRVRSWTEGVPIEQEAIQQLRNRAELPIIHSHIAVMPDVHWGNGATVGSVIPTVRAIIPAAVGVDIGCGMMAVRTTLTSHQLPESLKDVRAQIEHDALAAADDASALEVLWQAAIEAYRRGDLSGVVAAIDKASSWEREYGDDPGTSCLRDRILQDVE